MRFGFHTSLVRVEPTSLHTVCLCVAVGVIVVVKMEGPSYLCKTDEVGEICVSSEATGSQYWGLAGLTNSTFKVQALLADGKPLSDALYTRSGLLGFLGPVRYTSLT